MGVNAEPAGMRLPYAYALPRIARGTDQGAAKDRIRSYRPLTATLRPDLRIWAALISARPDQTTYGRAGYAGRRRIL